MGFTSFLKKVGLGIIRYLPMITGAGQAITEFIPAAAPAVDKLDQISVLVMTIERATFPVPWTPENFLHEIHRNPFACNRVVRSVRGSVEGYASAWMVDREVRINNVAVREDSRRRGLGQALMRHLMDLGRMSGCTVATLEVRPSNSPALKLYAKLGFREVGRRKAYYTDTREDALVLQAPL